MRTSIRMTLILLTFISFLCATQPCLLASELVQEANKGREGQKFDINPLLVAGKTTIFDFYSPFCPPCRTIAPLLEKLAAKRSDLKIFKLNINRAGVRGNDSSPLVKQYQIRGVPYFMIFDPQKKLIAKGPEAVQMCLQWCNEANIQ